VAHRRGLARIRRAADKASSYRATSTGSPRSKYVRAYFAHVDEGSCPVRASGNTANVATSLPEWAPSPECRPRVEGVLGIEDLPCPRVGAGDPDCSGVDVWGSGVGSHLGRATGPCNHREEGRPRPGSSSTCAGLTATQPATARATPACNV